SRGREYSLSFKFYELSHKASVGAQGPDRDLAKDWEKEHQSAETIDGSSFYIYLHQPKFINCENNNGNISENMSGTTNAGTSNMFMASKRNLGKVSTLAPQHEQPDENVNDNDVTLRSPGYESEDEYILQEDPCAIIDCKLIINNVCIRSAMEKWRESSKYVEEIHKQDLMRYNILDTTSSSATKARTLFKKHWDDIISTIEGVLTSASTSASADQDTEHDGQAEEVKQYMKEILTNVNSATKLHETIKTEHAKLQADGNIKWKRRALGLMKIFRDQFPNGRNCFQEDQTEDDYIIRFVSRVYIMLFKDKTTLKCSWRKKTLRSSAALLNQSLKDDDRRCSDKIDAILSMKFRAPSHLEHTHYVGDRNKTAKMLKIILNFIKINYSGCFEEFRKIKVYGVQIYDHNFYIYSMCMPFAGIYYFKLEKRFTCPTMTFLLFKQLPKFALNLRMLQDMITSSTESILTYVTNTTSESSDDDTMIDKVKPSPKKNKKKKNE
ncbi:51_t:CDS:10, partial [Paraglomus occultum]